MDWLLPFRPPADGWSSDPGLPKWLLRHILRLGRISIGSHVLVAGSGTLDLANYLDGMAIDATRLDDPRTRFGSPRSGAPPLSQNGFDAVISRETSEHQGDLLGPGALVATARLAASLLPRGHLILIGRFDPPGAGLKKRGQAPRDASIPSEVLGRRSKPVPVFSSVEPGGHLESCYRRHLECFPGSCQVSHLADSLASRSTWNWMLGRQPRSGFVIASLAVPAVRIPRAEWERIADAAAQARSQPCCLWAAAGAPSAPGLKSAA